MNTKMRLLAIPTLALGAMHALLAAGRRVPEDVAVIGFDNTDEGQYSQPTLTTIDPGRREIADLAVETVTRRIADRELPVQHVAVDWSLVEREST